MLQIASANPWLLALFINAILIWCASSFPLLTPKGSIHAGALGTILWGCLGWTGWLTVVIYLFLGSLVTRLGLDQKEQQGVAQEHGGRRGPSNVWGSAAVGAILAILIKLGIGNQEVLFVGFAASFTAKLADTFGSEIGKRWGRATVLITNLRKVPRGTDGAISLEGTFASLIGGLIMTSAFVFLSIIPIGILSVFVFFSGFIATLLESYIGAIYQKRIYWLTNELVNFIQTFLASILSMILAASYL